MFLIEVESIKKNYGRKLALSGVSFSIQKGEIVGVVGPNGAGKTTLLRILSCFIPPTEGRVKIDGIDTFQSIKNSLLTREKIGYFIERVPLYQDMKVFPFLKFVSEIKVRDKRQRKRLIELVIEKCHLEDVANVYIRNLSRGYRQRVGLAQTFLNDPDLIILDEPTVGLDPVQASEIRELIRQMVGDKTIIFSSHILSEVDRLANRVIILNEGKIVANDSLERLNEIARPSIQVKVMIEGPVEEVFTEIGNITGVIKVTKTDISKNIIGCIIEAKPDSDIPGQLSALATRNQWILREIVVRKMSLEEVFLTLISEA